MSRANAYTRILPDDPTRRRVHARARGFAPHNLLRESTADGTGYGRTTGLAHGVRPSSAAAAAASDPARWVVGEDPLPAAPAAPLPSAAVAADSSTSEAPPTWWMWAKVLAQMEKDRDLNPPLRRGVSASESESVGDAGVVSGGGGDGGDRSSGEKIKVGGTETSRGKKTRKRMPRVVRAGAVTKHHHPASSTGSSSASSSSLSSSAAAGQTAAQLEETLRSVRAGVWGE